MSVLVPFAILAGFLVFAAWVIETAAPNPLVEEDRRQPASAADRQRYERKVASLAVFVLAVLFAFALTYPQGTP